MTWPEVRVEPGASVQVADYPPGAVFGPRRLADYEFVWMLGGSATWTVHGGEAAAPDRLHLLTPGTLGLARIRTVDSYQWDEHRNSSHAYVHFRLAEPVPHLGSQEDWPTLRSLPGHPVLDGLCSYLLQLAQHPSAPARMRTDQLIGLLLDLFVAGPHDGSVQRLPDQLARVAAQVRRVWATDGPRPLSTDELAVASGFSPGHLFRLFRETFRCPPARALELLRLARAATSLQRSNASVAEVAAATGFANPYHFSRRFTAVYGSPPGRFRLLPAAPAPLDPVRAAGLLPLFQAVQP